MRCPACGAENSDIARFCGTCGGRLTQACPHCAAPVSLAASFCTTCGGALPARSAAELEEPERAALAAERRRVSVLFADLENFTGLTESLDPEAVRSIQSRYFEIARSAVAAYGDTIEKFIGDAVVAVWGAPVAHEDDAERAVRAALQLVEGVPAGGASVGAALVARAAVATGDAAVTIGAQGQGIVTGDVINTAARLQSAAPAGGVLVDERTRSAFSPDSPLSFGAPTSLQLKGKRQSVSASMVTIGQGQTASAGHSGAFVGREIELRELLGLVDTVVTERRSRMVSLVGIAGIGKSRLTWELRRALRERAAVIEWSTGRARAYGDGIVFAAVRDIVRQRCGIGERDDLELARRQLSSTLAALIPDPDEREWVEPRLDVLLDSADAAGFEREELFGAWRRFFEHLSEQAPTVLVFEDLHWADAGLLDFLEHLGSWAREHQLLIVTLARPELLDRRPTWGAALRAFTTIRLEPLTDDAMGALLETRAKGISRKAERHILDRAGGVPLYAVELVRMLIDREQLVAGPSGYRLATELGASDIPDSLHGILAARIDALPVAERSLLLDAAVLGSSFSTDALAAVSGLGSAELRRRVSALLQRELLAHDDDLRTPDRRTLTFVQELVRELAYRTISRAERATMHLAAAGHFESVGGGELVERVAGHLAAAYEADPEAPGATATASRARELTRRAARRALAVHAPGRAVELLDRALGMAPGDADERAALLEEAAEAARLAGRLDLAEHHLRELMASFADGAPGDQDRWRAQLSNVLLMAHHNAEALAELEAAVSASEGHDGTDVRSPELAGQLARALLLDGRSADASRWAAVARDAALRAGQPAVATDALVTRGTARFAAGDESAGIADLEAAVDEARANDLLATQLRARNNLAWLTVSDDPHATLRVAAEGTELARRMGLGDWLVQMADLGCLAARETGDWDWALATYADLEEEPIPTAYRIDLAASIGVIRVLRGTPDPLAPLTTLEPIDPATDRQDLASIDHARAWEAFVRGDLAAASAHAEAAVASSLGAERHHAAALRARSRLWDGDSSGLQSTLAELDGVRVHGRAADAARISLRAGLAALSGDADATDRYAAAIEAWRALSLPLGMALTLAERARFTGARDDGEAARLLRDLGATGLAGALERMATPVARAMPGT
jgi:class 3 adenylate cyclase